MTKQRFLLSFDVPATTFYVERKPSKWLAHFPLISADGNATLHNLCQDLLAQRPWCKRVSISLSGRSEKQKMRSSSTSSAQRSVFTSRRRQLAARVMRGGARASPLRPSRRFLRLRRRRSAPSRFLSLVFPRFSFEIIWAVAAGADIVMPMTIFIILIGITVMLMTKLVIITILLQSIVRTNFVTVVIS